MSEPRFLFCWFDTEYTRLELETAELLEVALIVTDGALAPLRPEPEGIPGELLRDDGFSACLKPPPEEAISEHVKKHYGPLLERCRRQGRPVAEIDRHLTTYMDTFAESAADSIRSRPVLAGNSIYADYFLARRHLPRFLSRLNYRLFDVSTLKLEWLNHYRGPRFEKLGQPDTIEAHYQGKDAILGDKHDAYYDVQASIAELAYYRSRLRKI